jgi:GntR family transcriptional regulator
VIAGGRALSLARGPEEGLGFRPLYRQVRDVLVKRIADGVWQAGQLLPSEGEIAADLGVSQGTVRKALDEMTAENLVVRRQGRGTYVAKHDDARILFQFFKLLPDSGERHFPESRVLSMELAADRQAAEVLGLSARSRVVVVDRVRSVGGELCVLERICLPPALFPGIEKRELPNNLYEVYATEFGVTVARATERLKAVPAGNREAEILSVRLGHPLLRIDRTAYALDGRPAEWRVWLCRTDSTHYLSELK